MNAKTRIGTLIVILSILFPGYQSFAGKKPLIKEIVPTINGKYAVPIYDKQDCVSEIQIIETSDRVIKYSHSIEYPQKYLPSSPALITRDNQIWQFINHGSFLKITLYLKSGDLQNLNVDMPPGKSILKIDVVPQIDHHALLIYLSGIDDRDHLQDVQTLWIEGSKVIVKELHSMNVCTSCKKGSWNWVSRFIKIFPSEYGPILTWKDTTTGVPAVADYDIFSSAIDNSLWKKTWQIQNEGHDGRQVLFDYENDLIMIWLSIEPNEKSIGHKIMWSKLKTNKNEFTSVEVIDIPFPNNPGITFREFKILKNEKDIYLFGETFSSNYREVDGKLYIWKYNGNNWQLLSDILNINANGKFYPYLSKSGFVSVLWEIGDQIFRSKLNDTKWSSRDSLHMEEIGNLYVLDGAGLIVKSVWKNGIKWEFY